MGAASARLGSLGVGCRADGSRVPGSGQLSDAAAVLGWWGGVRVGVWTPPSLVDVPRTVQGLGWLLSPPTSPAGRERGREGAQGSWPEGVRPGCHHPGPGTPCTLGLSGQPMCSPVGPCPEPGVTGRALGRHPMAPRQVLLPVLPALGVLGRCWGHSGCAVTVPWGLEADGRSARLRCVSGRLAPLSVHLPRWLLSGVNFRGTASRLTPRTLDGTPTPKPTFLPGWEQPPQSWFCF